MSDLILFQKFYDFTVGFYPIINRIPKSHRVTTGKLLEEKCISTLLNISLANKSTGDARKLLQKSISKDLDSLQILVRLCKDLRFVSVKQYVYQITKLNEKNRI